MIKNEGIIIKVNKYKEYDKIIYLVTSNGLLTLIAKSSFNYKSKNFSYTQELSKINFEYIKSNKKSFDILTVGKSVDLYLNIKSNYEILYEVSLILDLSYKSIEHISMYNYFYELLDFTLNNLNTTYNKFYLLIFKLKLLYLLGIGPVINECSNCGDKPSNLFSVESGGFVCSKCYKDGDYSSDYLSILKVLYLIHLDKITPELFKDIPSECYDFINNIIKDYYNKYLNIKL